MKLNLILALTLILTGCATPYVSLKVDKSPANVYSEVSKAVAAMAPTPISSCGDVWVQA